MLNKTAAGSRIFVMEFKTVSCATKNHHRDHCCFAYLVTCICFFKQAAGVLCIRSTVAYAPNAEAVCRVFSMGGAGGRTGAGRFTGDTKDQSGRVLRCCGLTANFHRLPCTDAAFRKKPALQLRRDHQFAELGTACGFQPVFHCTGYNGNYP